MHDYFKILIVEDEMLIAMDIKQLLMDYEFNNIHIVKDYNSAINHITLSTPDLIIIDVNLGSEKDGLDLGNYLYERSKAPFIYITSYDDKKTIESIIESKPCGFLTKPYKKIDVLAAVQIALNFNSVKKIDFHRMENPYSSEAPYIIKQIVSYISKNIEQPIEIDDLVKMTKWKKHHFIRIFSTYLGITPYNYILNTKIERAKVLILDENNKLENVAFDLGFQSYVNFARTFKNYTKLSPKAYRNIKNIQKKYIKF